MSDESRRNAFLTATILIVLFIVGSASYLNSQAALGIADSEIAKSFLHGSKKRITLYANGIVIRTWEGNFRVTSYNGGAKFSVDDCRVRITGTYVIEEIK